MNVLSALSPAVPARLQILRDVLPLHVIRGTQTLTVLVGFILIVLADGLWKRRTRAMQIAIALLLASTFLNLTKGLDFEEAVGSLVLAATLYWQRSAFTVSSRAAAPVRLVRRTTTLLVLYYGYLLIGFFILRRVIRPVPSLGGVTVEPFRLLQEDPGYHYLTAQAQWFERSLVVLGSLAVLYALISLLRPLLPHSDATQYDRLLAQRLLRRYGGDALSYFSLQAGRSYFFDNYGESFVSYRLQGTVALVGGDPIGPAHRIPGLLDSFFEFAEANGIDVCLLGIDRRYEHLYRAHGFKSLKIGEEAVIDLRSFDSNELKRKVRRAARHCSELGFTARIFCPSVLPGPIREQMEAINCSWIDAKGGEEKGFSMTLGRLPQEEDDDCRLVVATDGDVVWGYLSLVPIYGGNGWSLDVMRRRDDSPNGLTEFLVIRAAEFYRDEGYTSMSLNFATLANSVDDIDSRMLEGTRRFLYENLSSVYQLKSLYQFNSKFHPLWRSRYMAYRDVLKFPKLAVAIVQSEDPIRLATFVPGLRR